MFDPGIFLQNVTTSPGIYCFYDLGGQLLYVGKAANLKKRLASYFNSSKKSVKTQSMLTQVADIRVTVTASEAAALLLECQLIKEHHPKYNILMRDDKTYPYIMLSTHPYPRLDVYRGLRHKQGEFYGPFTNPSAVRATLKLMQKLFKLRVCRDQVFDARNRPCLQYQIERCTAPCVKKITVTDYAETVRACRLLLQGKSEEVVEKMMQQMDAASERQAYEEAAVYRDKIVDIRHIQSLQASSKVLETQEIFDSLVSTKKKYYLQRESLRDMLALTRLPERIECFDISHTFGEATIASCVVFNHEGALKQDYRRFSIANITRSDDYAAMQQAILRRYERVCREEGVLPDIVLIDGGWGQVNVAETVLVSLGLNSMTLLGISKGPERRAGHEKILIASSKKECLFEVNHPGFLLLQHIRDEAHRFALLGHRAARKKEKMTSILEQIPGVGAKRRRDLLRHFGGLQGIRQASEKDIAKLSGIGAALAKVIFDYLH